MTPKAFFLFLGKLIVGALTYVIGMMLGGMLAAMSGLQAPTLPPEMDANAALVTLSATSPLLVLALYAVGRKLAGGWLARSLVLALLAWVAYTLNTVIEGVVFSRYVTAPWFNLLSFTPAVLLCAGVTAWLFPSHNRTEAFIRTWQTHFQQRTGGAWRWRLLGAALSFMPIYYFFGTLVVPFVGDYYQQGSFGLAAPPLPTLLAVLLLRSVLFFMACLPVVVAWRGAKWELWLSLGFALFVLVGLLYMLAGNWLPLTMRMIHSLEILADSLVHAGVLVWLLTGATVPRREQPASAPGGWWGHKRSNSIRNSVSRPNQFVCTSFMDKPTKSRRLELFRERMVKGPFLDSSIRHQPTPRTRGGAMIIHWDFVKQRTLWSYEDLIKKLGQTLSYAFVQALYNHSMDEAIDYVNEVHAGYLQHRGDRAWLDGLITNFAWLQRAGVQNYLDLVQRVDNREKCEAFLKESGMGFPELIETLHYLLRWVLPFPTPLREFFDTADATQMAYWQALKQHRITTDLDLLEQGGTAAKRDHLAAATGIPAAFLLRLTHQADLARLAYVRGKTVRHLCGGGYDTLAKLAAAELPELEAAMNGYYLALGKQPAAFKAVVPLGLLIGGAHTLPPVLDAAN